MDAPERQLESDARPACFDPDAPDLSEQQFSASLEAEPERPAFVVDAGEGPTEIEGIFLRSAQTELLSDSSGDSRPRLSSRVELDNSISSQEHPNHTDSVISIKTDGRDARLPTINSRVEPASQSVASDPAPDWRDQVSAKVNKYKSSKAPKVRYPSLQLQFDPPAPRRRGEMDIERDLPVETAMRDVEVPQARQVHQAFVTLEATARVIEFPRQASPPPIGDELAEPVLDRPRIVEAPALLPPPPALGGILIDEVGGQEPERRPGFDMPLQTAPLSRRLLAGAVDGLFVAGALTIFGYTFLRFNGPIQQWKLALQVTATLVAILWPTYQYAFLVFTGSTPGLRLARLAVTHFDGTPVPRGLRRWRVLASLLSWLSLGIGYAWCFLDEDQLSWHDRITKTHLAREHFTLVKNN
jgi:uncharacterized RDD family membrane protein YckC